jgi:hypothetical protein
MRAMLYERSGQFMQESKIWERVGKIDGEDADYLEYLGRRQDEEQDRVYLTDELPDGGRRFLAYPRRLVYASASALLGCMFFLIFARTATAADPNQQAITLAVFAILVLAPWVAIGVAYLRTIRHVSVSENGIEIAFRFSVVKVALEDLAHAWIVHDQSPRNPQLALVLIPKDEGASAVSIDLMLGTTAIRARSYFVRDVEKYVKDLGNVRLAEVFEKHLKHRKILSV